MRKAPRYDWTLLFLLLTPHKTRCTQHLTFITSGAFLLTVGSSLQPVIVTGDSSSQPSAGDDGRTATPLLDESSPRWSFVLSPSPPPLSIYPPIALTLFGPPTEALIRHNHPENDLSAEQSERLVHIVWRSQLPRWRYREKREGLLRSAPTVCRIGPEYPSCTTGPRL